MELNFSEKNFFLNAFQGVNLTFVLSENSHITPQKLAAFGDILDQLTQHGGRCLILYQETASVVNALRPLFSSLSQFMVRIRMGENLQRIPSHLMNNQSPLIFIAVSAHTPQLFKQKITIIGLTLRISRLIWLDSKGGITDANHQTVGFINNTSLAQIINPEDTLLKCFHTLLNGGVGAISLCRLEDLHQELFTYAGCGSFFSQHHYCHIQRLGLDDFPHAITLIRQGEIEGFLLPRDETALSELLANGYGAYILGKHLAGVCALQTVDYQQERAGEIISLYALTRFQGATVGGQLLRYVIEDAKIMGIESLFACTQHERVASFFCQNHFSRVQTKQIPSKKWVGYDPHRKETLICLSMNLREME